MALVMVIDDERDSCSLISRMLRREGHRVTAFTRAQDAVAGIRKTNPDLCVVSAGKHGEQAKETLELLRNAGIAGADIVLCASLGSLGLVRKAFSREVRAVLDKTADLEKLAALVKGAFPQ